MMAIILFLHGPSKIVFHNNFYGAVTPAVILAEAGTGVSTTNGNRHSRAGGNFNL